MNQLDYLTAVVLGIVQGLTEFLPVSSSGHLALTQAWFDLQPDSPQMLLFDVLAHLGTLLAVLIVLNILFYYLMRAPTKSGRLLMDQIEGFKLYLSTAEEDRLNALNPPEKTPELFEKYLPYALALGVDQAWSERFSDVLSRAAAEDDGYRPRWYSGNRFSNFSSGGFSSSLGSSLSKAVASSSVAPGSSSGGGGGGFSGGGGGGGGGGGW